MTRRAGTVTLSDVGKRFVKYEDAPTLVEGLAKLAKRHRRSRLWAVRHVDLDVAPGEAVGVIGRNGSGKTTLLTMLAGVTAPTEGTVRVRGRLAPLLGLGVGFDPELTGRENVYINGSILGMTRREIDRNFDEIVAFAEIPKFIDTPVKFYSSGMNVRLGFAVAISSQPDLLLVDEVLAVGDVGFQQKSFNRMREMQEEGTTILVVSHNATAIRVLAQRVLVLHDGAAHFLGPTREAIDTYFQLMKVTREAPVSAEHAADAPARVESLQIFNESGTPSLSIEHDETVTVRMRVRFERAVDEPVVLFTIRDETDVLLYAERSRELRDHDVRAGDEVTALLRFPMRLAGGTYRLRGAVAWAHGASSTDWSDEVSFFVSTRPFVRGLVDLKPVFEFETRARGTGAPQ